MPAFQIVLPSGSEAGPRTGGFNAMIVHAATSADAIAAAKAYFSDDNDNAWGAATATEIVGVSDLTGLQVAIRVSFAGANFPGRTETIEFLVTAGSSSTPATLATALAAALNADAGLANASASGAVVTIAAADNAGDLVITSEARLNGIAIPGLAPTVNAAGAAGIDRTITLPTGSLLGASINVTVADPTNPVDITVYFGQTETWDLILARLVVLMNATTLLSNVTYTSATQVVLIPGATDAQGAKVITCTVKKDGVAQTALQPTITAAGISSIDRNITFPADAVVPLVRVPTVLAAYKS